MWGFPGASRPFQGAPGASRGFQEIQEAFERKMRPAAYCQSLEPWARLKSHTGWSGWTRPPTMAGEGGGGVTRLYLQGGVEGVLKGSQRPEAGCLGELNEARKFT